MKANPKPWLTTWSTGCFSLKAMWPTTVKIAKPAKIEVPQLTKQTRTASEKQLLLNLLYEDNAMSPPQAALSEKKICVAAFFQVSASCSLVMFDMFPM